MREHNITVEKRLTSGFLEDLEPYSPISSRDKILQGNMTCDLPPLKLDWNESTLPPSVAVKNAIVDAMANNQNLLNWYPELYSKELRRKLADYTGRSSDEILVTNGSDDALDLICKVFLEPHDQVLIPSPTYTHFLTYAKSRSADLRIIEADDPFKADITPILENLTPATKLIYVVNPNNPTGVLLDRQQVATLCTVASHSIVIIDEAYFEFSGKTVLPLLDEFPNLIVTRTFSKAWALAGLRIGYLLTNIDLISQLMKVLNPKSVSSLAQVAAAAAIDDKQYMEKYVQDVKNCKLAMLDFFRKKEIKAYDSQANYIMVQHPRLQKLLSEMEKENIFVRDRSTFKNLPGFFRVTLADHTQTSDFLERMEKVLERV